MLGEFTQLSSHKVLHLQSSVANFTILSNPRLPDHSKPKLNKPHDGLGQWYEWYPISSSQIYFFLERSVRITLGDRRKSLSLHNHHAKISHPTEGKEVWEVMGPYLVSGK